jgi:plasmid stabilization system protein ParE
MDIKIYWTDFSKNELRAIFRFYKEKASLKIARKLVLGINQEVMKLKNQPDMGQREELLANRKQKFRYLVYKNYKCIYWFNIDKNRIEITDVFDTRQDPVKMNEENRTPEK